MGYRRALLAGATGLIGGHVLDLLLADPTYDEVTALVRRPLEIEHEKLGERVVDFDRLADEEPPAADDVFCCLGSTMKKAGSKAAFRKVDHDYVVATARLGLAGGGQQFFLVSSIGADAKSMYFYSRVKGEAEASVAELGYEACHIFQPSILMGERDENRPGERLGIAAARVLNHLRAGPLRGYRGIAPATVASAMVSAARQPEEERQDTASRRIYTYGAIRRLAGQS